MLQELDCGGRSVMGNHDCIWQAADLLQIKTLTIARLSATLIETKPRVVKSLPCKFESTDSNGAGGWLTNRRISETTREYFERVVGDIFISGILTFKLLKVCKQTYCNPGR